jgi:hypothetical protein
MTYVADQARQDLLDIVADQIDSIGRGLESLGAAYEALDETTADRLEEQLFRPVQTAYGRLQRTHNGFAERFGLPTRTFAPADSSSPGRSVSDHLDRALSAIADADIGLSTLQDSMMPVEVGDPELRAGLADVRSLLGDVPGRAREFARTLGR